MDVYENIDITIERLNIYLIQVTKRANYSYHTQSVLEKADVNVPSW